MTEPPESVHNSSPSFPAKEDIRKRIVEEDTLLGGRTMVFLTSNGFFLTAISVTTISVFRVTICILGVLIAAIWLTTTTQLWKVITALHELYHSRYGDDPINKTVFDAIHWKKTYGKTIFGPTELISLWLPGLILTAWLSIGVMLAAASFPQRLPVGQSTLGPPPTSTPKPNPVFPSPAATADPRNTTSKPSTPPSGLSTKP